MSIEIAVAGAERVDELEPLWLALHRHHRAVAAAPVVGDDDASWVRRRAWYLDMLAGGDDVVLIAQRAGRPVGYAFLHLHHGPDDTWPVGERWGEVVSLSVLPEERVKPVLRHHPAPRRSERGRARRERGRGAGRGVARPGFRP